MHPRTHLVRLGELLNGLVVAQHRVAQAVLDAIQVSVEVMEVALAHAKVGALHFDAVIHLAQLGISLHELRGQQVALRQHRGELVLLSLAFLVRFLDNPLQFHDFHALILNNDFTGLHLLADLRELVFQQFTLLVDAVVQKVLFYNHVVLRGDFFFHLLNVVVHRPEFHLENINFLLRIDELLRVEIAVCAHTLVQTLLLLELDLIRDDLFVEFLDLQFL
mmetsp:Transcript_1096/g.1842  ORF Transcript_1096/g.1842 Transcript_1096/m.1842 type:complete len:220 (-) Transcript_1096:1347-2006(-)